MQKILLLGLLAILMGSCTSTQPALNTVNMDWTTPFEKNTNYTPTHDEVIAYYEKLAKAFPHQFRFETSGMTDVGRPLHTGVIALDGDFDYQKYKKENNEKVVIFINNAIHPGEPTGVDATMMLVRDLLTKAEMKPYLQHAVFVFIPMYNIGGALNRGSF